MAVGPGNPVHLDWVGPGRESEAQRPARAVDLRHAHVQRRQLLRRRWPWQAVLLRGYRVHDAVHAGRWGASAPGITRLREVKVGLGEEDGACVQAGGVEWILEWLDSLILIVSVSGRREETPFIYTTTDSGQVCLTQSMCPDGHRTGGRGVSSGTDDGVCRVRRGREPGRGSKYS